MGEEESSQKVYFERIKRVGIITLKNGEMNVFDRNQIIQFRDIIKQLETDDKTRVVIIQGSGTRAFSSGFDLKHIDKEVIINEGQEMIYRLYNLTKPTIALVHGYSIGIGFLIPLACDFRYATKDASFSLPEIKYEIMFFTHGGCSILPKLVRKPSDVKYIFFTGDRFPASKADEMGLLDAIFETKEEMYATGLEFATKISKKNPLVMACAKVALKKATYSDVKTGMAMEIETIPFIDRPPTMNKRQQLEAAQKYIDKYSEKW
ncbi:MAG: enoyl-CoA hydratase/isomerase family protein [Candidatus Helarchaeota archaeon]